jgi:prenyltransferase beta subunit
VRAASAQLRRAALLGACCVAALTATPASAGAPDGTNQARLDRTVRYLQEVQNLDGGFAGKRGNASDVLFSCWVAVGLAAAGINPHDQKRPGGVDVYTFIERNTREYKQTTDYQRTLLAVLAAGESGRGFAGIDLVAKILERQLPDGGFPQTATGKQGWINSTAFAILPLSRIDGAAERAAVQRGADWLIANQNPNGSWASSSLAAGQDADMTGAVIQALSRAGRSDSDAVRRALDFLRTMQGPDGGFAAVTPGGETNSGTTAWVVQGLWAVGIDPRTWRREGGDPLDFLGSLQQPDGSIVWMRSKPELNPVWMTAYAAPALAGQPLPVPAPPRAVQPPTGPPPAPPPSAPAPSAQVPPPTGPVKGRGGTSRQRGDGVIAGGGGRGAPLFSRPQPQSQGRSAGGVRGVARRHASRRQESTRRRPTPERAPDEPLPTATSNGAASAGVVATASAAQRAGGGGGEPGDGNGGDGGGDGTVTGKVIGGDDAGTPGRGDRDAIAPGLLGAQAGGERESELAYGLAVAMLVAAAFGVGQERRGGAGGGRPPTGRRRWRARRGPQAART